MHKGSQVKSDGKRKNNSPQGWDVAVAKAETKIEELKRAILIFQDQKRRGESFPGEKSESRKLRR